MTSKPVILEIASSLLHEADSRELKELKETIDEEIEKRRRIGI